MVSIFAIRIVAPCNTLGEGISAPQQYYECGISASTPVIDLIENALEN